MKKPLPLICMMALAFAASAPSIVLAQEHPRAMRAVPVDPNTANRVTPALQSWQAGEGALALSATSRIVLPASASARTQEIAALLKRDIARISGLDPAIVSGSARAGDIVLQIGDPKAESQSAEAYALNIGDRAALTGRSEAGLLYATQSLLQLLKHDQAGRALQVGAGADWPDYEMRVMMLDVGRKYYEIAELDNLMRQMAWLKMNVLRLHFNDWNAFRLNSPNYPGLAAPQSYDRADVVHLQQTAARYGITIIPEVDVPAHAAALISYKPSLGFQCESMRQSPWLSRAAPENVEDKAWTIDVTREENRAWIRDLLAEFIPWFSSPYFHIGGDEYQYDVDKVRCPELMAAVRERGFQYPGDVFVDWTNETNAFVKSQGKTTMIWNWWRFKDDQTSIQPDTDIVVEVWNTPRLQAIIDDGYQVVVMPEDRLYVSPGIENFDGSGYGLVDIRAVYEDMPLERGERIKGYGLALWADSAENRTDAAMLGRAYEPMAIVAERSWSDSASTSIDAFLVRLNKAGAAPRATD